MENNNKICFECKQKPICSYQGCKNKPYKKFKGFRPVKVWLCKKHYLEENKNNKIILKNKDF